MTAQLKFLAQEWEYLKQVCELGYPKEVCGVLLGREGDGVGVSAEVLKVRTLTNILEPGHAEKLEKLIAAGAVSLNLERARAGGNYEFAIDPSEHFKVLELAQKQGLDQVGLFHSHPDHPPRPSPTDQSQPFLAGWSNIIVAVDRGKFQAALSWRRERDNDPFQEEKIIVV